MRFTDEGNDASREPSRRLEVQVEQQQGTRIWGWGKLLARDFEPEPEPGPVIPRDYTVDERLLVYDQDDGKAFCLSIAIAARITIGLLALVGLAFTG